MPLTPVQRQERSDFVLSRLKRGFSFAETEKMFTKQYGVGYRTARRWVRSACDYLVETRSTEEQMRSYKVILEIYHDQIVAYQGELLAIAEECDRLNGVIQVREAILTELRTVTGGRHQELIEELKQYPSVSPSEKSNLLELKTVVRERMNRVIRDLARLHGLHLIHSDWRKALGTLLDSNLIPTSVAEAILQSIAEFESRLQSSVASTRD